MNKVRVFFDMDGTLAEWQYGTAFEKLYEPGYFLNLPPYEKMVSAVRQLVINMKDSPVEFFVLSAYFHDSRTAHREKEQWLDRWLPEIDDMHRIFVPCGEKKSEFVPGGIRSTDILFDDYTKNLLEWGGIGVKVLNGGNGKSGTCHNNMVSVHSPDDVLFNQMATFFSRAQDLSVISDDMAHGTACSCCGHSFQSGEAFAVHPDTGAVFCGECVLDGMMEEEPDEEDND